MKTRMMIFTTTTKDNEDGIWVNINDLEEPWYPLKEYKPKYTIPIDIIIEDSSTVCQLKKIKIIKKYIYIHICIYI